MKKKILIVGNGFASLFFIQYFLATPVFPVFIGWLLHRLYSRYEITVIGNGKFVYYPAIPEFITGKKNIQSVTIDVRPFLKRRNIRFIEGEVTDIRDTGKTVITTGPDECRRSVGCAREDANVRSP